MQSPDSIYIMHKFYKAAVLAATLQPCCVHCTHAHLVAVWAAGSCWLGCQLVVHALRMRSCTSCAPQLQFLVPAWRALLQSHVHCTECWQSVFAAPGLAHVL
jgi:hypothetical protein